MSEYTPTWEEIREEYAHGAQDVDMDGNVVVSLEEVYARADRFLKTRRRMWVEAGMNAGRLELDSPPDAVNRPSHYTNFSNGAEVIDITENLNFNRGNAVKYLARAGAKDPATELEDLQKASWYVEREIKRVQERT